LELSETVLTLKSGKTALPSRHSSLATTLGKSFVAFGSPGPLEMKKTGGFSPIWAVFPTFCPRDPKNGFGGAQDAENSIFGASGTENSTFGAS